MESQRKRGALSREAPDVAGVAAEGVEVDPRFGKFDRFLSPIQARFGVKFIF